MIWLGDAEFWMPAGISGAGQVPGMSVTVTYHAEPNGRRWIRQLRSRAAGEL